MNQHDDAGVRLGDSIRQHVAELPADTLTLSDIQGRATGIRRRRRIAAAGAVLAVAAVVTPFALAIGNGTDGSLPPGPARSPSDSSTPTAGVRTVTLSADAPAGDPPQMLWLEGRALNRPDGTGTPLDRDYDRVATIGDLLVLGWSDADANRHLLVTGDEERGDQTFDVVDEVVVSDSGTVGAFTGPDGSITVLWDGGTAQLPEQPAPVTPVHVEGEDSCGDGATCRVFFTDQAGGGAGVASTDGSTVPLAGAVALDDVAGSWAAVRTRAGGLEPACSEIRDLDAGRRLWDTCDHAFLRFSPDGTHVLGVASDSDGLGYGTVTVLESATGEEVLEVRPTDPGFIGRLAWEDDQHLLATAWSYEDESWTVHRIGLDGSAEVAAGPVRGVDADNPFAFEGKLTG